MTVARYGAIEVAHQPDLDGGGTGFGQAFVPVVRALFGKVGRVHEFCAGPGYIGFSLLGHGLCDSLCLSDINPRAVEVARETVRRNGLEDRVSVYLADALEGIPAGERWDLVVSNPPHFRDAYEGSLRHHDPGWDCHRRFYAGVKAHLNPKASVLMQENYEGSVASDFAGMIATSGLASRATLIHRVMEPTLDSYYFLWAAMPDAPPSPMDPSQVVQLDGSTSILDLDLGAGRARTLRLEPHCLYQLRLVNHTPSAIGLHVRHERLGFWRRFLRSVATIPPRASVTTYPFQMAPGRYQLCDTASRKCLARLVVE